MEYITSNQKQLPIEYTIINNTDFPFCFFHNYYPISLIYEGKTFHNVTQFIYYHVIPSEFKSFREELLEEKENENLELLFDSLLSKVQEKKMMEIIEEYFSQQFETLNDRNNDNILYVNAKNNLLNTKKKTLFYESSNDYLLGITTMDINLLQKGDHVYDYSNIVSKNLYGRALENVRDKLREKFFNHHLIRQYYLYLILQYELTENDNFLIVDNLSETLEKIVESKEYQNPNEKEENIQRFFSTIIDNFEKNNSKENFIMSLDVKDIQTKLQQDKELLNILIRSIIYPKVLFYYLLQSYLPKLKEKKEHEKKLFIFNKYLEHFWTVFPENSTVTELQEEMRMLEKTKVEKLVDFYYDLFSKDKFLKLFSNTTPGSPSLHSKILLDPAYQKLLTQIDNVEKSILLNEEKLTTIVSKNILEEKKLNNEIKLFLQKDEEYKQDEDNFIVINRDLDINNYIALKQQLQTLDQVLPIRNTKLFHELIDNFTKLALELKFKLLPTESFSSESTDLKNLWKLCCEMSLRFTYKNSTENNRIVYYTNNFFQCWNRNLATKLHYEEKFYDKFPRSNEHLFIFSLINPKSEKTNDIFFIQLLKKQIHFLYNILYTTIGKQNVINKDNAIESLLKFCNFSSEFLTKRVYNIEIPEELTDFYFPNETNEEVKNLFWNIILNEFYVLLSSFLLQDILSITTMKEETKVFMMINKMKELIIKSNLYLSYHNESNGIISTLLTKYENNLLLTIIDLYRKFSSTEPKKVNAKIIQLLTNHEGEEDEEDEEKDEEKEEKKEEEKTEDRIKSYYPGITNFSNECWINSSLQLLLNIDDLFLMDNTDDKNIHEIWKIILMLKKNAIEEKRNFFELPTDIKRKILDLFSSSSSFLEEKEEKEEKMEVEEDEEKTTKPKSAITYSEYDAMKLFIEQNDVQEFMFFLFDKIFNIADSNNIFSIKIKNTVQCKTTKTLLSVREENMNFIQLKFPIQNQTEEVNETMEKNEDEISLDTLFTTYLQEETLSENNILIEYQHNCPEQIKYMEFLETNKYIFVVIERFNADHEKIHTNVTNLQNINILGKNYLLEGMIEHNGETIERGHYITTLFLSSGDGYKIILNDSNVQVISQNETEFSSSECYILLYKAQELKEKDDQNLITQNLDHFLLQNNLSSNKNPNNSDDEDEIDDKYKKKMNISFLDVDEKRMILFFITNFLKKNNFTNINSKQVYKIYEELMFQKSSLTKGFLQNHLNFFQPDLEKMTEYARIPSSDFNLRDYLVSITTFLASDNANLNKGMSASFKWVLNLTNGKQGFLKFFYSKKFISSLIFARNEKENREIRDDIYASLCGLQYEIFTYKNITNPLLDRNICPHFIRSIGSSLRTPFSVLKEIISKTTSKIIPFPPDISFRENNKNFESIKYDMLLLEVKTQNTLYNFLSQLVNETNLSKQMKFKYILNVFFQIVFTCHVMSLSKMTHNDLHGSNILVEQLPTVEKWSYIVNDKTYTLFTKYKVYIFDFDRSFVVSLGKNRNLELNTFLCHYVSQCNENINNIDVIKVICNIYREFPEIYDEKLSACIGKTKEDRDNLKRVLNIKRKHHTGKIDCNFENPSIDKEEKINKVDPPSFYEKLDRKFCDHFYNTNEILDNLYNIYGKTIIKPSEKGYSDFVGGTSPITQEFICKDDMFDTNGLLKSEE